MRGCGLHTHRLRCYGSGVAWRHGSDGGSVQGTCAHHETARRTWRQPQPNRQLGTASISVRSFWFLLLAHEFLYSCLFCCVQFGNHALFWAATGGQVEAVAYLLEHTASDLNRHAFGGNTALMYLSPPLCRVTLAASNIDLFLCVEGMRRMAGTSK
jgi:hypothetical protein